jgi:hypothetical protein
MYFGLVFFTVIYSHKKMDSTSLTKLPLHTLLPFQTSSPSKFPIYQNWTALESSTEIISTISTFRAITNSNLIRGSYWRELVFLFFCSKRSCKFGDTTLHKAGALGWYFLYSSLCLIIQPCLSSPIYYNTMNWNTQKVYLVCISIIVNTAGCIRIKFAYLNRVQTK